MAAQWPLEATQAQVTAAIRAEMARHGIDQQHLAEALGTSQQSISRRLCGTTRLTVEEIITIAEIIGCPASRLLTP